MVHLSVYSTRNGVRYFPHKGFLGLTPVRVEGLVRTKLDADGKLLPATSITVAIRCWEARLGRTGTIVQRTVVECLQTLWSNQDDAEYTDIGELELPFRITLPVDAGGYSTASFVEYRCCWKVEAVLNHIPITGVGNRQVKSFDLPLLRYSIPKQLPSLPPSSCQPEFRQIRSDLFYSLYIPPASYGPLDLIPVIIRLTTRHFFIRSATVAVERRISFKPTSIASPSLDTPTMSVDDASEQYSFTTSDTQPLIPNPAPLTLPPSPMSDSITKSITAHIATVESSGEFAMDPQGFFSKTLTLKWPDTKSNSRWAVGETLNSDFCSVRFYARTKIVLGTPLGHELVELPEEEIAIVSTNEAQRQLAIGKAIDDGMMPVPGRSKSSSRRAQHGLSETNSAGSVSHDARVQQTDQSRTVPSSATPLPPPPAPHHRSSSRRPHTSAGPRDKPKALSGQHHASSHAPPVGESRRKSVMNGGILQISAADPHRKPTSAKSSSFTPTLKWKTHQVHTTPHPQPQPNTRTESASSDTTVSSSDSPETPISAHILAWEQELARIEAKSRRSSAKMFGIHGKPQRRTDEQRTPLQDVSCQ